jgi:DNA-binding protein HU-beta
MNLNDDESRMLTHVQNLVGKDITEAFIAAVSNPAAGDRLPSVLRFLAGEGFGDDVVIAAVWALADPAFVGANATLEGIQGVVYLLKGAVEAERALPNATALKEMRALAAEQFAAFQARRDKRMQKPQVLAHLAAKVSLSEKAVESVLNELIELAIQETNAHDTFDIPGIGTVVKLVREERMGRNPQTGEPISIPAKTVVKFRLETRLKTRCGDSLADPAGL